jgi:hypothetical protein
MIILIIVEPPEFYGKDRTSFGFDKTKKPGLFGHQTRLKK